MYEWQFCFAMDSGVRRSWRSTAAPLSSNSVATAKWPFWQATSSGVAPFFRPIDLRAFVQQQRAPRRRGRCWQAIHSGVDRSSPGRPPRRCPAAAAPRRRGPGGRRCTAASCRSRSPFFDLRAFLQQQPRRVNVAVLTCDE